MTGILLYEVLPRDGEPIRIYLDALPSGVPADSAVLNHASLCFLYASTFLRKAREHGLVSDEQVARLESLGFSARCGADTQSHGAGLWSEVQVHAGQVVVEAAEQRCICALGELQQGQDLRHDFLGDGQGPVGVVDEQVMPHGEEPSLNGSSIVSQPTGAGR